MVIARKIAYNVLFSSIAKVFSTVLALVSIGIITRYLGKDGFGDYATVLAFFSFFSALSDLGLYSISTREISRPGADEAKIMGNIFALRVAVSTLILLVSPLIVFFFPYSFDLKLGILIAAAAFLFSSSYQILNGVFQKNLAMDKVAAAELLGKIVQVAVILAAAKLGLGFSWVMSSLLFYMILSFGVVFFWSRKFLKFSLQWDFSYWKKFLHESYPLGISAVITFLYFKLDTIMLSVMKSSSEVGIYNAAYKVMENITFFPSMIVGLIFPIMSEHIFSDFKKFEDIANKTLKVFLLMIVPLLAGTMFLADGVIRLIGGAGFSESAGVLRILIFALAGIFFSNFFNAALISGRQQKKLMIILGLAAVVNVSLNLTLIPRFSYLGAAWVSVATEVFVALAAFYLSLSTLKYRPRPEKASRIFFAGAIMGIFMFVFREYNFYFLAFSSVLIYAFCLWILGAVRTEEILSIVSRKGVKEYETIP